MFTNVCKGVTLRVGRVDRYAYCCQSNDDDVYIAAPLNDSKSGATKEGQYPHFDRDRLRTPTLLGQRSMSMPLELVTRSAMGVRGDHRVSNPVVATHR
jgi:hypothetical protein